jgi:hypothetical protein
VKRHVTGEFQKLHIRPFNFFVSSDKLCFISMESLATIGVQKQELRFWTNIGEVVFEAWDIGGDDKNASFRNGY